jgi:hypothetical protein
MSTTRDMQQGCHKVRSFPHTYISIYINFAPQTNGVHLALFADDICLYTTDRKEGLFSENSSAVSVQWRPSVSAGISKLIKLDSEGLFLP